MWWISSSCAFERIYFCLIKTALRTFYTHICVCVTCLTGCLSFSVKWINVTFDDWERLWKTTTDTLWLVSYIQYCWFNSKYSSGHVWKKLPVLKSGQEKWGVTINRCQCIVFSNEYVRLLCSILNPVNNNKW